MRTLKIFLETTCFCFTLFVFGNIIYYMEGKKSKRYAPSEDRTHDLKIMRLTRCLLRHRGICVTYR